MIKAKKKIMLLLCVAVMLVAAFSYSKLITKAATANIRYESESEAKQKPKKIKCNKHYTIKSESQTYEFTAPATGLYRLHISRFYGGYIYYNGKQLNYQNDLFNFYKLKKGKTYKVEIFYAGGMGTRDKIPKFEICRITKKSIALNKKVKAKEGVFYRFTPKETGLYLINGGTYIISNTSTEIEIGPGILENQKWVSSYAKNVYQLQKGKTYDILVNYFVPKNSTLSIKKTSIVTKDKIQYLQLADKTWEVIKIDKSVKKADIAEKISGKDVTVISMVKGEGSDALTEVNIPASVTTIKAPAFGGCNNIEKINFAEGSNLKTILKNEEPGPQNWLFMGTKWEEQQNGLVYLGRIAYCYYGEMEKNTTIKLQQGTKVIRNGALNNENLSGVEIPQGVTTIEGYAIYCGNMKSLYVPSSVKNIGEHAFYAFPKNFVLTGKKGSYVEKYAKEYNIKFKAVSCKKHKFVKDGNKQICTVCGKKK